MPTRPAPTRSEPTPYLSANLTLLQGRLGRQPQRRQMPSGQDVLELDVRVVEQAPGSVETVNVVWFDAPRSADLLAADDAVLIVGRVRRRFFRANGSTQSRTEVVAEEVVPLRRNARVRQCRARFAARLAELS